MEFKEKLVMLQSKVKAPKDKNNSFGKYKYRSAESILEATKPHLQDLKLILTLSDDIKIIGDRVYVKAFAKLTDVESTEELEVSAFARESLVKKGMDDSQITGTASSYARKYALNGLLLLDDTKDADTNEHKKELDNTPAKQSKPKLIAQKQKDALIKLLESKGMSEANIQEGIDNLTQERYTEVVDKLNGGQK